VIDPMLASLLAGAAAVLVLVAAHSWRRRTGQLLVGVLAPADAGRPERPERRPERAWLDHAPLVGSHRTARRRHAIEAEIPQLLDLLAAGSSAGLSAPLALRRAGEALRGPLGPELRAVFDSVDLGARWSEQLAALALRWRSPDLRRAVSVLVRTETLGSSLSEATRELAASVRQARRAASSERARTAPVKMLFPLVFLVLPAFLLLTVVPVLLTTLRSIA
jgi:pilus assembly protein TadC